VIGSPLTKHQPQLSATLKIRGDPRKVPPNSAARAKFVARFRQVHALYR
jgi:hypothetical protein